MLLPLSLNEYPDGFLKNQLNLLLLLLLLFFTFEGEMDHTSPLHNA